MNPYKSPTNNDGNRAIKIYMIPIAILAFIVIIPFSIIILILGVISQDPITGGTPTLEDYKSEMTTAWNMIVGIE